MSLLYLATCAELPEGDEDATLLTEALAAVGINAQWQSWDDPRATWDDASTLIRSTWNYTRDRAGFLAWAQSVPTLLNPPVVLEWSSDKIYLAELSAAGLPVVPTAAFAPGASAVFPAGTEFVVKPSVGAGSRGCGRFEPDALRAATEHAAALQSDGLTALVQPYLEAVDQVGETALLYFDGSFSHSITKAAMLPKGTIHPTTSPAKGAAEASGEPAALFVEERIAARAASARELAVGDAAIEFIRSRFGADLLYARVDVLPSAEGPVIGELELVEPSLFLSYSQGAAAAFAKAVAAHLT